MCGMSVQRCGVADSVVGESRRELNDRSQRSEPPSPLALVRCVTQIANSSVPCVDFG